MPRSLSTKPVQTVMPPMTALDIGVFEYDVSRDLIHLDAVTARLFGLPVAEAMRGLPWDRVAATMHPDDLPEGDRQRQRFLERGGLFVWEHRILSASGTVRWVLTRGRYERTASGEMRGRGIVIDTTALRAEGHVHGSVPFLTTPGASGTILERIADHVIEVWELASELDPGDREHLHRLLKPLTHELGRRLAAAMTAGRSAVDIGSMH